MADAPAAGEEPPGQPTSAEDRARRNRQVVAARARGLSWDSVASTYGLSVRRCEEIWSEYRRGQPKLKEIDPVDVIEEMLLQYDGAAEELALVAATADQGATRVGAIRTRLQVLLQKTELMQATGVLPNDLGRLRVDIDLRVMAQRILAVFDANDVPDEVQEAVMAAITGQDPALPAGRG
jgi:hypothetical protein